MCIRDRYQIWFAVFPNKFCRRLCIFHSYQKYWRNARQIAENVFLYLAFFFSHHFRPIFAQCFGGFAWLGWRKNAICQNAKIQHYFGKRYLAQQKIYFSRNRIFDHCRSLFCMLFFGRHFSFFQTTIFWVIAVLYFSNYRFRHDFLVLYETCLLYTSDAADE